MGEGRERREPKGSVTPKQGARHRKGKDAVGEREAGGREEVILIEAHWA